MVAMHMGLDWERSSSNHRPTMDRVFLTACTDPKKQVIAAVKWFKTAVHSPPGKRMSHTVSVITVDLKDSACETFTTIEKHTNTVEIVSENLKLMYQQQESRLLNPKHNSIVFTRI